MRESLGDAVDDAVATLADGQARRPSRLRRHWSATRRMPDRRAASRPCRKSRRGPFDGPCVLAPEVSEIRPRHGSPPRPTVCVPTSAGLIPASSQISPSSRCARASASLRSWTVGIPLVPSREAVTERQHVLARALVGVGHDPAGQTGFCAPILVAFGAPDLHDRMARDRRRPARRIRAAEAIPRRQRRDRAASAGDHRAASCPCRGGARPFRRALCRSPRLDGGHGIDQKGRDVGHCRRVSQQLLVGPQRADDRRCFFARGDSHPRDCRFAFGAGRPTRCRWGRSRYPQARSASVAAHVVRPPSACATRSRPSVLMSTLPFKSVRKSLAPCSCSLVTVFGDGWPYGLPQPGADDGHARVERVDEGVRRRRATAVVRDLEDVNRPAETRRYSLRRGAADRSPARRRP